MEPHDGVMASSGTAVVSGHGSHKYVLEVIDDTSNSFIVLTRQQCHQ